jgi:hypothetical protein
MPEHENAPHSVVARHHGVSMGRRGINSASSDSGSGKPWALVPLIPKYLEPEHGGYVGAIEAALDNAEIRNIAVSGSYGVGKSSILREVARKQVRRVVELSLSALAPIEASNLDESVPKQATTPTNRIQQEIVKQLLYREEPGKMPGSRFRRIERFQWGREVAVAILLALAVTVIFLLTAWSGMIAAALVPLVDLELWVHVLVFGVAFVVALSVRRLLNGRIHVKQLSAGSATVTLDDKSVSYFDQYLDEIVYFFEVSGREIVIFEDIDRFNDSHIFETLRSLNALLNASPQINKPIRFIYAIRDSIFDQIELEHEGRKPEHEFKGIDDPAEAEVVRANRTKFFDLVVPVVPFITHRSARNLAAQLLGDIEHDVSADLLDLAGRYIPDMRLIKNVRNEFIVFRDRIFSGDGTQLNLSETNLFAMMLYKSTHLTDFETIRTGKSNLDRLYAAGRRLVAVNIKRIERETRDIRNRLARLDSVAARSGQLGNQLFAYIDRVAEHSGFINEHRRFTVGGAATTEAELRETAFWRAFVEPDEDQILTVINNRGQQLKFRRTALSTSLSDPLKLADWDESERDRLQATLDEDVASLNFLRGADMGALIKRPEFLVGYGASEQPLDAIARELFTEGLAYQLVRAGYIDRNFTLYTSTFHGGRVGPAATNFIIHHVDRDVMDEHFELGAEDVAAVVRELGDEALSRPAMYNIAILDNLLHKDSDAAQIMIRSLEPLGDDQTRFLQSYLSSGNEFVRFVQYFTAASSRVLVYLVSRQLEVDDMRRLELVGVALGSLIDGEQYRTDSDLSAYLSARYADLSVLTSEPISEALAERIALIFADAGIRIPALEPLSNTVRQAFVEHSLYEINRKNLQIAIGSEESLALDVVRLAGQAVYSHVLANLDAYLSAIDETSATVEANVRFIPTIEDVLNENATWLGDVIEHASTDCVVTNLSDVAEEAWPALAEHDRFPPTFSNISGYVKSMGALDTNVAKVLASARAISDHDTVGEDRKRELAKVMLAARDSLPSASLRAELVAGLCLDDYLDVNEISAENGELFALLLKHGIVQDDQAIFAHLAGTTWATRECVIQASTRFKDYMTPALVQRDLAELLLSDKVEMAIKTVIVDQASDYFETSDVRVLAQLAIFASQHEREIAVDVIWKMAAAGVQHQDVVSLLNPHLAAIGREELIGILESLGGDYAKLTSVGRDKPKITNTSANRALLECLKGHGIVNSYSENESVIKVNKKHK